MSGRAVRPHRAALLNKQQNIRFATDPEGGPQSNLPLTNSIPITLHEPSRFAPALGGGVGREPARCAIRDKLL